MQSGSEAPGEEKTVQTLHTSFYNGELPSLPNKMEELAAQDHWKSNLMFTEEWLDKLTPDVTLRFPFHLVLSYLV